MEPEHRIRDWQSQRPNQAAMDALRQQPERWLAVLATLDHWDAVAPRASKPLREERREILLGGLWERALATDDRGQQLPQCSPLGRALLARRRLEIIRAYKGPTRALDPRCGRDHEPVEALQREQQLEDPAEARRADA